MKTDDKENKTLGLGKKGRRIVAIEAIVSISIIFTLYVAFLPYEIVDAFILSTILFLVATFIITKDIDGSLIKRENENNKNSKKEKIVINSDTIKEIEKNKAKKKNVNDGKFGIIIPDAEKPENPFNKNKNFESLDNE